MRSRSRLAAWIKSGDAREVHHLAMLIAFGADAINPYMVFESIDELVKSGDILEVSTEKGIENYRKAAAKGVTKIMSKMGISTLASYTGAQLFDVTGLSQDTCDEYFTGSVSPIDGIGPGDLKIRELCLRLADGTLAVLAEAGDGAQALAALDA